MLTFRQLDDAGDAAVRLFAETEQAIINDMARRIAKAGKLTDTAQWQALRLEQIGLAEEHIRAELARVLRQSEAEIMAIFDEAATRALEADNALARAAGKTLVPLAQNAALQRLLRAGLTKTMGTYQNLTRTTANTATRQFENTLDLMHQMIMTGSYDYQSAIKVGVNKLTEKGIASITYPATGHADYLDVAFRRATLTGANQTVAEMQLENMTQLGTDLVETTAHGGARPDHAQWQGKVFSVSGRSTKYPWISAPMENGGAGYGNGDGLCGWNCRHSFFPWFEGISEPSQAAAQIRAMNAKTVKYNGKEMSLYDATQQQRYIERQIRKYKRRESAYTEAGLGSAEARKKVKEWQTAQRDFIEQTGLRRDYFRERAGKQFTTGGRVGATLRKPITAATEAKSFDDFKGYMERAYAIKVDDGLRQLDLHSIAESASGVEKVLGDFPQLRGVFTEMGLTTGRGAVMDCSYSGRIGFSSHYYADAQKAAYSVKNEHGFHPANHTLRGTGIHEAGHLIESYLVRNDPQYAIKSLAWNDCSVAKEIVSEACKQVKKTPAGKGMRNMEMMRGISGYAAEYTRSETLAEAVEDWYNNGDNAQPLSKAIMDIIRRKM